MPNLVYRCTCRAVAAALGGPFGYAMVKADLDAMQQQTAAAITAMGGAAATVAAAQLATAAPSGGQKRTLGKSQAQPVGECFGGM